MICPSCGKEVPDLKFCVDCGAPLEQGSQTTAPLSDSATAPMGADEGQAQPVTQPVGPVTQPTEQMPESAWDAQPPQAYQTSQTMEMPAQPTAGGGYVPPSGAPQAPYQQSAPYRGPSGNQASNAAFVLVIVGLVLSVLFVTFVPGIICSIIGLVLNAGYNRKGLENPHKTSTMVIGIIGIVIAVLSFIATIAIGMLAAQVVQEVDRQGINLATDSVEVTTDSSGNINISVTDSSNSAAASGSSSHAASSASSTSSAALGSASSAAAALAKYEEAKYHDSEWNPSLYSLLELSGADLSDLLEYYNFRWDDDAKAWLASDGSLFAAYDAAGELNKSQIATLPVGGAGQATVYALIAEGYSSPAAALSGLAADIAVEDTNTQVDSACFAVVNGSPGVRYLTVVTKNDANEQAFLLFTDEAIANGVFAKLVGVDAGKSIDEVWNAMKAG